MPSLADKLGLNVEYNRPNKSLNEFNRAAYRFQAGNFFVPGNPKTALTGSE